MVQKIGKTTGLVTNRHGTKNEQKELLFNASSKDSATNTSKADVCNKKQVKTATLFNVKSNSNTIPNDKILATAAPTTTRIYPVLKSTANGIPPEKLFYI